MQGEKRVGGVKTSRIISPFIEKVADTVLDRRPKNRWKTALLMFGSAVVGASAVALWNRRTVAQLQAQAPAREEGVGTFPRRTGTRMEEEIF